jgi:putative flippase GtrA
MRFFSFAASRFKTNHVFRFVSVGLLNTCFSYLIYAGLLFVGLSYILANLLASVMGILFSFKTQGHLVFRNSDNRLLSRFVLSWVVIYLGSITLIGGMIALGLDSYSAGAVVVPIIAMVSYLTQKYFVFRQSGPAEAHLRSTRSKK